MPKSKYEYASYTIVGAGEGLYRAARVSPQDGSVEPLPAPYGDPVAKTYAVREACSALYRELALAVKTSPDMLTRRGLSDGFKITGR